MRSYVLTGMVRTPFGTVSSQAINGDGGTDDSSFWTNIFNTAVSVLGNWFGPSYDPNNGGELKRQLDEVHWTPFAQSTYVAWLKANGGTGSGSHYDQRMNPNRSPNGTVAHGFNIWASDGYSPSNFNDMMVTKFPGWNVLTASTIPAQVQQGNQGGGSPADQDALVTLAVQLSGVFGPLVQQQAEQIFSSLDAGTRAVVQQLLNAYLAEANANTGGGNTGGGNTGGGNTGGGNTGGGNTGGGGLDPKPQEAGFGEGGLLLAGLVLFGLATGNNN